MTEERRLDDVIVRCEGEGNGVTGRARVYGHRLIKRQDDGQRWMWVKFFARFHALFFYWLQYARAERTWRYVKDVGFTDTSARFDLMMLFEKSAHWPATFNPGSMWQTKAPRRSCAFTCIPFQHKGLCFGMLFWPFRFSSRGKNRLGWLNSPVS